MMLLQWKMTILQWKMVILQWKMMILQWKMMILLLKNDDLRTAKDKTDAELFDTQVR